MNQAIQDFSSKIRENNILFFDLDGTLVNTNFANYLSYIEAIKAVTGQDIDISYNSDERFTRQTLKKILPKITKSEYEKIILQKEKIYINHLPVTKLNKLVASILIRFAKSNRTVLVTNCRKERAYITLNYHGITKMFTNIFFREINSCKKVKNKYERAILDLEIDPAKIIAFEDEMIWIRRAISSGISAKNIWRV